MQKHFYLLIVCLLGIGCSSMPKTEKHAQRTPAANAGLTPEVPSLSGPFAILTKETLEGTVFSTGLNGLVTVSWSTQCTFDDGQDRKFDGQIIKKDARIPKLSCRDNNPSYATGKAILKEPLEVTGTFALLLDEELERIGIFSRDLGYNSLASTRIIDSKKVCLFERGENLQQASLKCNYRCSTLREMHREAKKGLECGRLARVEQPRDAFLAG